MTWVDRFLDGAPLREEACGEFSAWLLEESVPAPEKAEALMAFHQRGETAGEVAALCQAFLGHAVKLPVERSGAPLIDVCGTGGDRRGLFNVSTAAMFVVAGAGARVVKHGNRGITSRCGGADVLEALGVPIDLGPDAALGMLEKAGAVFLFAPRYHPAFKAVGEARQLAASRGSRTVFNILGPLLNPAEPDYQLAGVFDPSLLNLYAETLNLLGRKAAWVVHGGEGEDELSVLAPSRVVGIEAGRVHELLIDPRDVFPDPAEPSELIGADAPTNAALIRGILEGKNRSAAREMVVLNAAGALVVCHRADSLAEGIACAQEAIDSGAAAGVLAAMRGS